MRRWVWWYRTRKRAILCSIQKLRSWPHRPEGLEFVFVDVTEYNSKSYYVQGAVPSPGRIPITGRERILDAISFCNGLTPEADHEQVFLYRAQGPTESRCRLSRSTSIRSCCDDLSTNYQILAGDRLVVRSKAGLPDEKTKVASATIARRLGSLATNLDTPPPSRTLSPTKQPNLRASDTLEVRNP